MSLLQIVIDAIHDEQDWPGIAAGVVDQDDVERRQAANILATSEMESVRHALLHAAWNAAAWAYPASPAVVGPRTHENVNSLLRTYLADRCHMKADAIEWVLA